MDIEEGYRLSYRVCNQRVSRRDEVCVVQRVLNEGPQTLGRVGQRQGEPET